MEDVVVAVLPVRERGVVRAGLLNRLLRLNDLLLLEWLGQAFFTFEPVLVRRLQVHGVRVYDFGLFFKVKRLFVVLDLGACKFAVIVLPIVRKQRLWVGIAHEAVDAASLARSLVASGQRIER